MNLIQPNCRIQFTAPDVDFIVKVLGGKSQGNDFLCKLLNDETSRDLILDDPALYHGLLESPACLQVSTHFYFYVMVRHVFQLSNLDDRGLADYVAEILVTFSETKRADCLLAGQIQPMDYFFEMLAALQTADERNNFQLRLHIGNRALFLAGLFPERIRSRAELRGFPDLSYYEDLGRTHFRLAGNHRLARKYNLASILAALAECFQIARRALNDLADRLFHLGNGGFNLPMIQGI